jgi:riboflavin kinase/FMN adenylyltransferase
MARVAMAHRSLRGAGLEGPARSSTIARGDQRVQVVRGISEFTRRPVRPVLTIGNFDGLHVGHRKILETVVDRARQLGGESVLYTFDPHPRKVLQGDGGPKLLTTTGQKLEILEEAGLDWVVLQRFDHEFARTTPEQFVEEQIHRGIGPLEVYVGYDFHFGRDREGSMRLLTERGPHLGFSVTIIPEVTVGDRDVNSTRIRGLIADGDVDEASQLLGRAYSVRGRVVEGMKRGRGLGFPTANLEPENEILPGAGVYAGQVRFLEGEFAGQIHGAVTNVGYRPTFDDGRDLVAEAHVIDFTGDLYGSVVELSFETRLRGELKFDSVEALRARIEQDVEEARAWLSRA